MSDVSELSENEDKSDIEPEEDDVDAVKGKHGVDFCTQTYFDVGDAVVQCIPEPIEETETKPPVVHLEPAFAEWPQDVAAVCGSTLELQCILNGNKPIGQ